MLTPITTEPISATHPIAYFSAEFGFDSQVPIYAGGLGILAGDVLKQAADDQLPMVGVGLLYRGDGMRQTIDEFGMQQDEDWQFDPVSVGIEHVFVDNLPLFVSVHLGETTIWLRVWKKTFGPTVVLYLLDSETDQNTLAERNSTRILYSGSTEYMLKQAILLGVGGVKALTALGIHPSVFHLNEGRPAFLNWQLIRQFMDFHGISYEAAKNLAKQKTVYTNHTLVGAANLSFDPNVICHYGQYYSAKMKISCQDLVQTGLEGDPAGFSITRFALNTSHMANGVSALHSKLSAESWPEYHWTNVTNGVHLPTWQDSAINQTLSDPANIWHRHLELKKDLAQFILQTTGFTIHDDWMTISWARRLAGYKRLDALFADEDRLRALLTRPDQPVQLLLSGKAHQGDQHGKEMLQKIIQVLGEKFSGHVLFIPNYSIAIAQQLTRGSDLWINTPEIGREACGTSGMKALSNGVLQCTVPDGWGAEVEWQGIGWTLDSNQISESLYSQLENQIIPLYYQKETSIPEKWVTMMQSSIRLAPKFSASRMLNEYTRSLYGQGEKS